MRIVKCLTVTVSMLMLSACVAQPENDAVLSGVDLQLVKLQVKGGPNDPKSFEVISGENNRCKNPNNIGCVRVAAGKIGVVTFKLLQSNHWTLTTMLICNGTNKPDECTLTPEGIKDFTAVNDELELEAEPNSQGVIDLTLLGSPLSEYQVIDRNETKANYFYRIQACPKDGGDCLWLDPPWENDGSGVGTFH